VVNIEVQVQLQPYLEGRKNIKIYTGIPHITTPESGGLELNSSYGDGPEIIRQEGTGNGPLVTDLTDASTLEILASNLGQSYHPVYVGGKGPYR
jgi:hypothetical protein